MIEAINVLPLLKTDLMVSSPELDEYLIQLIGASIGYIETEGIVLDSGPDDVQLVEMYAAYLYRRRREPESAGGMPRMLRWALNNRIFNERKAGGGCHG